ncbi:MAG: nucleotide exchange factor GrpE [Clostridiales bacterium]|jgi:molecular chaperone GrpE|nr:nucleotide exchange factor GrpE [Clostridiales bacterium]
MEETMDRKKKAGPEQMPESQEGAQPAPANTSKPDQPQDMADSLQELEEARAMQEEYLALAQRVQADYDNFRKRNRQVAAESYEDGARAFIKTILPVVDNLERALQVEQDQEDPLYQGVTLVQKQLLDALKARGVTPIDRKGEPFDPKLEDAVAQGSPEEGTPGTVCEVVIKGYQMGENVLRHAMVRVVPDL